MTSKEMYELPEYGPALSKFEITFMAEHGGGRAGALFKMDPDERVRHLGALGFQVKNRRYCDRGTEWASLSGGIEVCLTDGYVCTAKRRM